MRPALPISKYRLLRKKQDQAAENELKLKLQARAFRYAAYAAKLLFEGKHPVVHLHATGPATPRVVQTVEYLRKRIANLHVAYNIESIEFLDEYHPIEEGLDVVTIRRLIPALKAQLSVGSETGLDKGAGYMSPLPADQVLDQEAFRQRVEQHFNREAGGPGAGQDEGEGGEGRGAPRGRGGRGGFRGSRGGFRGGRGGFRGGRGGFRGGRGGFRGRNNFNEGGESQNRPRFESESQGGFRGRGGPRSGDERRPSNSFRGRGGFRHREEYGNTNEDYNEPRHTGNSFRGRGGRAHQDDDYRGGQQGHFQSRGGYQQHQQGGYQGGRGGDREGRYDNNRRDGGYGGYQSNQGRDDRLYATRSGSQYGNERNRDRSQGQGQSQGQGRRNNQQYGGDRNQERERYNDYGGRPNNRQRTDYGEEREQRGGNARGRDFRDEGANSGRNAPPRRDSENYGRQEREEGDSGKVDFRGRSSRGRGRFPRGGRPE